MAMANKTAGSILITLGILFYMGIWITTSGYCGWQIRQGYIDACEQEKCNDKVGANALGMI